MKLRFALRWVCSALCLLGCFAVNAAESPYKVMLLTGVNNHDWRSTTPAIQDALIKGQIFNVRVVTTPEVDGAEEAWAKLNLDFQAYDAVVMNWTDFGAKAPKRPWMDGLIQYVTGGGALVVIHAASLEKVPEWPRIKGLGWMDNVSSVRLAVGEDGQVHRTPNGEGQGTGHGSPFAWEVTMRAPSHPVSRGLPIVWPHSKDELWHSTRGPAENLEVIATAFSPITKTNEPVMWTVKPGKGRVFVTLLGHDETAVRCPGFAHTLVRGTEWAIRGEVTVSVPPGFPKGAK